MVAIAISLLVSIAPSSFIMECGSAAGTAGFGSESPAVCRPGHVDAGLLEARSVGTVTAQIGRAHV